MEEEYESGKRHTETLRRVIEGQGTETQTGTLNDTGYLIPTSFSRGQDSGPEFSVTCKDVRKNMETIRHSYTGPNR